jgi:hypothetical protein
MAVGGESTNARCIEPFRTATLHGWKTSADAAVSSAQLTFVTFLGQFRIEFGSLSSRANEVHLILLLCQNNDGSGVDATASVPYPMTQTKLQYIPSSCQNPQAETNSARGHGAALFALYARVRRGCAIQTGLQGNSSRQ